MRFTPDAVIGESASILCESCWRDISWATDLENWKNIIDQMCSKIEAEVKRLEGTPKSHVRNGRNFSCSAMSR